MSRLLTARSDKAKDSTVVEKKKSGVSSSTEWIVCDETPGYTDPDFTKVLSASNMLRCKRKTHAHTDLLLMSNNTELPNIVTHDVTRCRPVGGEGAWEGGVCV